MRQILRLLVPLALLVATAAQAAPGDLALHAGSKLWLTGSSTVHDYHSNASKLDATFRCDPALWPAGLSGAEAVAGLIRAKGVTGMDVVIQVTGMKSGKEGLDKNMYKALLAEKHPEIRFRMAGYEVGAVTDTVTRIDVKGTLTVAGVDQEIAMAASMRRHGDAMRMTCDVPLLMTQFGVKPPKMMLGTIKTSDKVTVHFDLMIGAPEAAATAGTE
ncbi:MAG TPA: YceI family protein [Candidatus Eisenbacteria bacterium]|nr:YceI family protein [Candidatus Eisenbacteria bacterium]